MKYSEGVASNLRRLVLVMTLRARFRGGNIASRPEFWEHSLVRPGALFVFLFPATGGRHVVPGVGSREPYLYPAVNMTGVRKLRLRFAEYEMHP